MFSGKILMFIVKEKKKKLEMSFIPDFIGIQSRQKDYNSEKTLQKDKSHLNNFKHVLNLPIMILARGGLSWPGPQCTYSQGIFHSVSINPVPGNK